VDDYRSSKLVIYLSQGGHETHRLEVVTMPTLIDAGKRPMRAPQPPGDVDRDVEVGKLLWIRGEARYGLGSFLSDRPAPTSVPCPC